MNDVASVIERYVAIGRRQWWVILQAVVVVAAVAGFVAGRAADPPFRASTTLIVTDIAATQTRPGAADLRLAQRNSQVNDPAVLEAAARAVPGETPASIAAAMRSSIDRTSGSIVIAATALDATRPVAIADAVADAFIADHKTKAAQAMSQALAQQQGDLERIQRDLSALPTAPALNGTDPAKPQRDALSAQAAAAATQIAQLKNEIAVASPGVEVLFPAATAARGAKPSPVSRAAAGVVIGGIVGVGLAAFREALDKRVRTRERLEHEVPWPLIADLPEFEAQMGRRLLTLQEPNGALAESVRRLRTSLRFLGGDNGLRTVVVTSPQPGDGKTMVSANLAVSCAQMGIDTVLVSGDLRRPALDALFLTQKAPGLSDALVAGTTPIPGDEFGFGPVGDSHVEGLLRRTGIDNLRFLPTGALPPNPAELLASERTAKIVAELARVAEMVIIDSPPTVVVDPTLLGQAADGVLLVTALDHTTVGPLRHAVATLSNAPLRVLGVVANRDRHQRGTYGEYYYGRADDQVVPERAPTRRTDSKRRKRTRRRRS